MKKKPFVLSKHELEVMNVLWSEDRALSRTEIMELSVNRSWKDSTIHILINKLLEKEAITVDGFVKTNKNFGRTYKAKITEGEYQVMQFKTGSTYKKNQEKAVLNFMSALFADEKIDSATLDRLQQLIQKEENE